MDHSTRERYFSFFQEPDTTPKDCDSHPGQSSRNIRTLMTRGRGSFVVPGLKRYIIRWDPTFFKGGFSCSVPDAGKKTLDTQSAA